jgi:hypothetical protein
MPLHNAARKHESIAKSRKYGRISIPTALVIEILTECLVGKDSYYPRGSALLSYDGGRRIYLTLIRHSNDPHRPPSMERGLSH